MLRSSNNDALVTFVDLAKNQSGKGLLIMVKQILKHPSIYTFDEFISLPSIQALNNIDECKSYCQLLNIFAYGTYQDYSSNQSTLPSLSPIEIKKLRQLSLISLASQSSILSYQDLQKQLQIDTVRELEDIIIDTIYEGLIEATIDQRNQKIDVSRCAGRDIAANDVKMMREKIGQWLDDVNQLAFTLDNKIQQVNSKIQSNKILNEQLINEQKNVETIVKESAKQDANKDTNFLGLKVPVLAFKGNQRR